MSRRSQKATPSVENDGLVPLEEQKGPPPLVEDLSDTNDLPEGFDLPDQSTYPDPSVYEEEQ